MDQDKLKTDILTRILVHLLY